MMKKEKKIKLDQYQSLIERRLHAQNAHFEVIHDRR